MKTKQISIGLPADLKQKAVELADKKTISLNALVRIALVEFIEKEQKDVRRN